MAKVLFKDALQDEEVVLTNKFLVVETNHDGYTNTGLGQRAFRVIEEEGELKVFAIYMREDEVYVNEKYPVIQTDGDLVLFSKNTMIDPYGATHIEEMEVKEGQKKEHIILQAFESYVLDAFRLAVYHILIADANTIDDTDVEFEYIKEYERDVIHPWAGTYRAGQVYK